MLNPSLADDLNTSPSKADAPAANDPYSEDQQANQLANLIQNSTLLKSYEQLMQQFEADNDRKQKQVSQLERDQQQLLHENNLMSDQLYQLKSKNLTSAADPNGD